MSRFQFVADHRDAFEVKWLCAVVEIARSSFYAWLAAADNRAAKTAADEESGGTVSGRCTHEDNTYGAPRITAELNDGVPEAERVNHKRVARVMRTAGIAGYRRRRRVKTTVADPANQKVPDLLGRDFTAAAPNTTYVGDITICRWPPAGTCMSPSVIDCCSRRVAEWAIADDMRTELVEDALTAADSLRGGLTSSGVRFRITEVSTPQRISAALCRGWGSPSRWARWEQCGQRVGRIFPTPPSNVRGPSPRRQLLGGRRHLPPRSVPMVGPLQHEATSFSACRYVAPINYKETTHPLHCPKPHNHKSRVRCPG